jgi:polyisoprenoid-binding protein YceI
MTAPTSAPTSTVTTWTIDPTHTLIEFSAKHMMITTVKGRFAGMRGTIEIDGEHPDRSKAEIEIETPSIDTRVDQRDQHLRSGDFLDVEHFPTLTFRSRRIEGAKATEGSRFRVIGDLTIRGISREVTLDATYEGRGRDPWGGERVSFSATTRIDRRDFGLTWNAALEAGGVLVSNEIRIAIEAQAVRAA